MSRLTITEKEHWKSRIEKRIDRAIEALQSQNISLMPSINAFAELEAHKSIGTFELHQRIEAIKQQVKDLESEKDGLVAEMYQVALGKQSISNISSYLLPSEFWSLHRQAVARFETKLLMESELGQQIVRMRSERESLLDTVWLATSSLQIRDLWSRVSEVLEDPTTQLQQKILTEGPINS